MRAAFVISAIFGLIVSMHPATADDRPADIVELSEIDPSIAIDMIYFSSENFVGRPIRGYRANVCLLTGVAAERLRQAQRRLREERPELTLLVRDCYRPRKAVAHFMEWARSPGGLEMKAIFYPDLTKRQIIEQGYVATHSGHSRASTIDLTIGRRTSEGGVASVPMGTRVDFFGEKSQTGYPGITAEERANRRLLMTVLGPEFRNYAKEWWHFTLRNEPYPNTSFDFDVEKPSLPRSVGLDTF